MSRWISKLNFVVLAIFMMLFSISHCFTQTTVASLEDPKANGYPDARKIVRDTNGVLYAAYRKKLGSAYQVYVSKSTNNGTNWSVTNSGNPVATISGACNQRVPAIAIDSANRLHVVWYGLDGGCVSTSNARQVKYSRSTNGGTSWTAVQNIANVTGYTDTYVYNGTTYTQVYWQEHPIIYVDGNDNLFVAWEGRDAVNQRIGQIKFIKSINNGTSWTAWKNVSQTTTSQSRPTITVDSNGKIFVFAYSKLPGTPAINIVYSTSTDGGTTFSNWAAISASSYDQRHSSAAIDSGNKIHLVWRQEDSASSGKTVIKYSKFTSPNWSAPVSVSPSAGYYQFFPSIANASGSQYIVWTETTDESGYVSESGSEEPITGKIVLGKKLQGTTSWVKSDVTTDSLSVFSQFKNTKFWLPKRIESLISGENVWSTIRWSSHSLNGGTIDIMFSNGSSNPYSLKYQSLGNWGS